MITEGKYDQPHFDNWRLAPRKARYLALWTDTFDNSEGIIGWTDDLEEAKKECEKSSGNMSPCYVYDLDAGGKMVFTRGTY